MVKATATTPFCLDMTERCKSGAKGVPFEYWALRYTQVQLQGCLYRCSGLGTILLRIDRMVTHSQGRLDALVSLAH